MKKIIIFLLTLFYSSTLILLTPIPSHAEDICAAVGNPAACTSCMNQGATFVWTALGCLDAGTPNNFIGQILGWATILGGGIAFLMAVFAGIQITTAAGDPKRVKSGQELLTSALSGLLLIIFSIFLMNIVGIKILGLGSLGGFQP